MTKREREREEEGRRRGGRGVGDLHRKHRFEGGHGGTSGVEGMEGRKGAVCQRDLRPGKGGERVCIAMAIWLVR